MNGKRYLTPDRVQQLRHGLSDDAKQEIELALQRFYADEIGLALSRRGATVVGAVLRAVIHLKGSPIAPPRRDADAVVPQIGHLLCDAMMAGYIAVTAKAYADGYDRARFVNPDGSANQESIRKGFVQGGAGIYGDYLFGQASRFFAEPLAGAAAQERETARGVINNYMAARSGHSAAGEWLHAVLLDTPFVNLSYTRPALDFLVLNALQESYAPGFLDRQRRKSGRDQAQSLLYPRLLATSQG